MSIFNIQNKREKTDEELLALFRQENDPEIAGELYSRYMHLVYGVCLKYLEDREESKDAVMQIFEKLLTEIPKHEINKFKSWLYVLTKNFCLMKIRSDKAKEKHRKIFLNDEHSFMEFQEEMHPIDEKRPDLNNALNECIQKLKAEQRECIKLFYFENKSYTEIAHALKMDEKKVKSHLQNGKRNLKICLEGKNGG